MSRAALERFRELSAMPQESLDKATRQELAGLSRQVENPELLESAKEAQKKGGVSAGHAVALTHVADSRNVCLCIRAVNPLATGLIEEGFGTKDMSIKAKSSNLPPLNGLIPFDQKYGKKGNDPAEVAKFNHKNEDAISAGVATKVAAKISTARLNFLAENLGGRFRMRREAPGLAPNEILLIGSDFKSPANPRGIDHYFVAVPEGQDAKLTIYPARQNGHGVWQRGDEPVQVMANRMGKAVTADYDLALVAPRIEDLGPEHMSPLKMTSFPEIARRTLVVARHSREISGLQDAYASAVSNDVKESILNQLQDKLPKVGESGKIKETLDRGLEAFKAGTLDGQLLRDMSRLAGEHAFLTTVVPEALAKNREPYPQSEETASRTQVPQKDFGIVSKFVRGLIPELNATVGQTNGVEVFHHGDDCGNPYSIEADNFPMTVILPKAAAGQGPQIEVVETSDEFFRLATDLKRQGYVVPINELWNSRPELRDILRESYTEARNALEAAFRGSVREMIEYVHLTSPA